MTIVLLSEAAAAGELLLDDVVVAAAVLLLELLWTEPSDCWVMTEDEDVEALLQGGGAAE